VDPGRRASENRRQETDLNAPIKMSALVALIVGFLALAGIVIGAIYFVGRSNQRAPLPYGEGMAYGML
jgi:hypothetical protein